MEDVAKKALDLIEKGVAKMGEVAPVVWEQMVQYNLALQVGTQLSFALLFAIAMVFLVKLAFPSHAAWQSAQEEHNEGQEIYAGVRGAIGYVIGVIGGFIGVIGSLSELTTTVATIYSPQAALLMKLLTEVKK